MAPSFELLAGLPGDGPYPEQFTVMGGTHREGFVVRVIPDRASPWVGNIQPGYLAVTRVVPHPDGRTLLASGWDAVGDVWQPIELDVRDGTVAASAYGSDVRRSGLRSIWHALKWNVARLLGQRGT
jgi:hypothetical protein